MSTLHYVSIKTDFMEWKNCLTVVWAAVVVAAAGPSWTDFVKEEEVVVVVAAAVVVGGPALVVAVVGVVELVDHHFAEVAYLKMWKKLELVNNCHHRDCSRLKFWGKCW